MTIMATLALIYRIYVVFVSIFKISGNKEARIHRAELWTILSSFMLQFVFLGLMLLVSDMNLAIAGIITVVIISTVLVSYRATLIFAHQVVEFKYIRGGYDIVEEKYRNMSESNTHPIFENAGFDSPNIAYSETRSLPIFSSQPQYRSNRDPVPAWNFFAIALEYIFFHLKRGIHNG